MQMYGDPAVREAIPGLIVDLRSDRRLLRVTSDRREAAARNQLATHLEHPREDGVARGAVGAATELAQSVLRGVLS